LGIMTGIRRFSKRKPLLGIIFVFVLAIGLVGSYIMWSSPGTKVASSQNQEPSPANTQQPEVSETEIKDQISKLESQISKLEKDSEGKPEDIATILKLGDYYYLVAASYNQIGEQDKAHDSFVKAKNYYKEALKVNPQEKNVNIRLGAAAFYAGDLLLAEKSYENAVNEDPDNPNARIAYGFMLSMREDYQAAIEQWQEILKRNPDKEIEDTVKTMIDQAKAAMEAIKQAEKEEKNEK